MPVTQIPLSEFAARRKALRTRLKGEVGLIFAGESNAYLADTFRPHPHFEYLTGITREPGAVLMLDPSNPVEAKRDHLFLPPVNPEINKWDGHRDEIGSTLKKATGFATIMRTGSLPRFLHEAAKRSRSLACLHPLAYHTQPVSPDLAVFRTVAERIPGTSIVDRSEHLAVMRATKSKAEIAMIQRAVDITAAGFDAMFRGLAPGLNEFDVQELLEHGYRSHGARRTAYGSIVGSGFNSTVLHYHANDQVIADGDLICIDSGAMYQGYAADITRTVPASGRFTKRQKEIYEIVLKAQLASIKACVPGASFAKIDKAARDIIEKAGFGDAFIHGIGHHLGLETHDITPDAKLTAGAVVTIEPGIYLPDENLGVRIEDDILVTAAGPKNLSVKIPKSIEAIERAMKR